MVCKVHKRYSITMCPTPALSRPLGEQRMASARVKWYNTMKDITEIPKVTLRIGNVKMRADSYKYFIECLYERITFWWISEHVHDFEFSGLFACENIFRDLDNTSAVRYTSSKILNFKKQWWYNFSEDNNIFYSFFISYPICKIKYIL